MWRSLIHLDLSFVQRDKNELICILLHTNCQLNQHHLLEMLSFVHWMFLDLLSKIKWPRCDGSFLGLQFYSIDQRVLFMEFMSSGLHGHHKYLSFHPYLIWRNGCMYLTLLYLVFPVLHVSHKSSCLSMNPALMMLWQDEWWVNWQYSPPQRDICTFWCSYKRSSCIFKQMKLVI